MNKINNRKEVASNQKRAKIKNQIVIRKNKSLLKITQALRNHHKNIPRENQQENKCLSKNQINNRKKTEQLMNNIYLQSSQRLTLNYLV